MQNPNLYILTGGPGAGKTTILAELENRGFRTVPEIARQLIQEQVQADGNALPWGDKKRYAKLMLERSIISFRHTLLSSIDRPGRHRGDGRVQFLPVCPNSISRLTVPERVWRNTLADPRRLRRLVHCNPGDLGGDGTSARQLFSIPGNR